MCPNDRAQPRRSRRLQSALLGACTATGLSLPSCGFVDYEPRPLDPLEVFDAVAAARPSLPTGSAAAGLSLHRVSDWLAQGNPDLKNALADWRTATLAADVTTPLPNPMLNVQESFGSGGGLSSNRTAPGVGATITIPLSDRRAQQDDLVTARAHRAGIEVIATWREQWIELRADLAALAVAKARAAARDALVDTNSTAVTAGRQLVDAGVADAADMSAFRLELARSELARVGDGAAVVDGEHRIARRTGVAHSLLTGAEGLALPTIPTALPDLGFLRRRARDRHPELLRAAADYQVADREFALAIERQLPDLQFNPWYGNEIGESFRVLGFALGLALPIFDRNQRQIAMTRAARDAAFTRFENLATRILADVDRAYSGVEQMARRMTIFAENIAPLAEQTLALSRAGATAGAIGVRRYIDAIRLAQTAQIEQVASRAAALQAWSTLERATGTPLLRFERPDQDDVEPHTPQALDALRPVTVTPSNEDSR